MSTSPHPRIAELVAAAEGDGTKATWLELRQTGISGSDFPRLLNGEAGEVYLSKVETDDERCDRDASLSPETARKFRHGLHAETFIAEELALETGGEVVLWPRHKIARHAAEPWRICTPDALAVIDGRLAVAEFKAWESFSSPMWSQPDESFKIPAGVYAQAAWNAAVLDVDRVVVVAKLGACFDFLVYQFDRPDGFLASTVERARDIWNDIQLGIMPPPDGTPALSKLIARQFPEWDDEITVEADEAFEELRAIAARASEVKKRAEAERAEALQRMALLAAERDPEFKRVRGDGWSLTRRRTKSGWTAAPRGF